MSSQYWFGEWTEGPLTAAGAGKLCEAARAHRAEVAKVPVEEVLRVLGAMRERWLDPAYPHRQTATALLPEVTGFSPQMIARGLEELCWTFDPRVLRKKLDRELPLIPGSASHRWEPLGVVLHVLAGNVFLGAGGALVLGLLSRNVNLFKLPSGERAFLPLLLRSLVECDQTNVLSRGQAVIDCPSSATEVIQTLKQGVDGVVVTGGEAAVRAYRNDLPARTRLVVFGPKLSLALVTSEALRETSPEALGERLAADVAIWDQSACTAPQVCYVEGEQNARRLTEAVAAGLAQLEKTLPAGALELDRAVEIRKLRTVFEVSDIQQEGLLRASEPNLAWTVVMDKDPELAPSPLHRTLRVIPVDSPATALLQCEQLRGYVQSVGLAAGRSEQSELIEQLARAGALRVVELGQMANGEVDDPHDGTYDLAQLSNLFFARVSPSTGDEALAWMSEAQRRRVIDERLLGLLAVAARAEVYARKLNGRRVQSVSDLPALSPLTREELEANMPPRGLGLSTGPWKGGYVTRSGGSTGEPKYSVYDAADWDRLISHAAGVFRALGLNSDDRLANFMLAGDLYGSFVSFDHVNHRVGLTTFAFGGNATPESFVKTWRDFGLNAVQGIPPLLLPLLKAAKRLEPALALEKVVYAGAPLSPADASWLRQELGVRRIGSLIGANDGGHIAYQCEALSGALHHTVDELNYLEVVDEKGQRVPDGTEGELLITSLLKYAFPLIRYRLGDRGRIVPGPCACGRTARVLEYLGRADDALCLGPLIVEHRDFVAALKSLPVSAVQLAARMEPTGEALVVRVETTSPSPEVAHAAREALLGSMQKVRARLDDGGLAGLRVEVLAPGGLSRNARSGKIRSVVDER